MSSQKRATHHDCKSYHLILADAYCPIYNGEHNDYDEIDKKSSRHFVATKCKKAFMMCTHPKCRNKISPKDGIEIPQETVDQIFINA